MVRKHAAQGTQWTLDIVFENYPDCNWYQWSSSSGHQHSRSHSDKTPSCISHPAM